MTDTKQAQNEEIVEELKALKQTVNDAINAFKNDSSKTEEDIKNLISIVKELNSQLAKLN